jgi:hypothetical protein
MEPFDRGQTTRGDWPYSDTLPCRRRMIMHGRWRMAVLFDIGYPLLVFSLGFALWLFFDTSRSNDTTTFVN